MDNGQLAEKAIGYITELYRGNSDGHDLDHSLRVYHTAMKIVANYSGCDMTVVALGALLHDVDDHKLFNTENNANARKFMECNNVTGAKADEICEVINSVSFSKNKDRDPATLEGKIVRDSDRLDAMGAVGIARTFAYGGKNGRSLDDSVQHFYDKLLLLKDLLYTDEAKRMGEERYQFLTGFLEEYKKETEERN